MNQQFVQASRAGLFVPRNFYSADEPFAPGARKPECDYLEMERLGAKLGIPVPMMHVGLESRDQHGKLVAEYKDRSRTYNRNFWNLLFGLFTQPAAGTATFGAGFLSIKSTGAGVAAPAFSFFYNGTSQFYPYLSFGALQGTLANTGAGIIVGTGTTAESFDGFVMATPVASGNGAGQLAYSAQVATATSYNAGTKVWTATIVRILNNNSGGTITVAETGLYGVWVPTGGSYMFCRDLLGATVGVANLGQLTVTYTITLTFPA